MADGVKDPLSMSLDDIIAKSSKRTESTRGRSGRGGRGGSRGAGSRGRERKSSELVKVVVRNEGRIQKPTGNRRPLGRGGRGFTEPDEPSHIKNRKLDGDLHWNHDKAPRDAAPVRRPVAAIAQDAPAATPRNVGSSQLILSNLDANVSDDDIKELFGSVGKLKSWAINYSRDGKSQGTANVEFLTAQEASAALQEFNGVHLDGKPMHIHQVMQVSHDPNQLSSGVQVSKPSAAAAPSRGGRILGMALASAGRESGQPRGRRQGTFGQMSMDMD